MDFFEIIGAGGGLATDVDDGLVDIVGAGGGFDEITGAGGGSIISTTSEPENFTQIVSFRNNFIKKKYLLSL